MFKNGTNLNRMENRAVKRNFYHIYQNSNMHKKVDMLFSQLDVLVLDFLSHGVTRDELKSHIDQVKEAS